MSAVEYRAGIFSRFEYEGHKISVILTTEFVNRFYQRKADPERTEWLLREGIKEALDMNHLHSCSLASSKRNHVISRIVMTGTQSVSVVLKAAKTKINLVLAMMMMPSKPPRIKVIANTIHVGQDFFTRTRDHVIPLAGSNKQSMQVIFERDYEEELVRAVLDHIEPLLKTMKDGAGYHLGDDAIDYIAEREGSKILIADAHWMHNFYAFEFAL